MKERYCNRENQNDWQGFVLLCSFVQKKLNNAKILVEQLTKIFRNFQSPSCSNSDVDFRDHRCFVRFTNVSTCKNLTFRFRRIGPATANIARLRVKLRHNFVARHTRQKLSNVRAIPIPFGGRRHLAQGGRGGRWSCFGYSLVFLFFRSRCRFLSCWIDSFFG